MPEPTDEELGTAIGTAVGCGCVLAFWGVIAIILVGAAFGWEWSVAPLLVLLWIWWERRARSR